MDPPCLLIVVGLRYLTACLPGCFKSLRQAVSLWRLRDWMDGWLDEWMDGWMNEGYDVIYVSLAHADELSELSVQMHMTHIQYMSSK